MADIKLNKPEAGANQTVPAEDGARFVLDFASDAASVARQDDNLEINFPDGARISIENFYTQYNAENLPEFEIEGQPVSADEFFTAMNEPDLSPAAGAAAAAAATGGRYRDYANAALGTGLDHLDRLDYQSNRAFEWDDNSWITQPDNEGDGVEAAQTILGRPTISAGYEAAQTISAQPIIPGRINNPITITPIDPEFGPTKEDPYLKDNPDNYVDGSNVGSKSGVVVVHDSGLPKGTRAGIAHTETKGEFEIDAPDGLKTITIDGKIIWQDGVLVGEENRTFETREGVLVIDAYDPDTGKLEYHYTLTRPGQHSDPAGNPVNEDITYKFTVGVTDVDGDAASSVITVKIVDDNPVANDDFDSIVEGSKLVATGNVVDGTTIIAETAIPTQGRDQIGADGLDRVEWGKVANESYSFVVEKNGDGNIVGNVKDEAGNTVGKLSLDENGDYKFVLDPAYDIPGSGMPDFKINYTAYDTDGDPAPATLTISFEGYDIPAGDNPGERITVTVMDPTVHEVTGDTPGTPDNPLVPDAKDLTGTENSLSHDIIIANVESVTPKDAHVAFLVDLSSSLGPKDLEDMQQGLKDTIKNLWENMSEGQSIDVLLVGFNIFARSYDTFTLDPDTKLEDINALIDKMYIGGWKKGDPMDLHDTGVDNRVGTSLLGATNYEHAFNLADQWFKNHEDWSKDTNTTFLITDGKPTAYIADGLPSIGAGVRTVTGDSHFRIWWHTKNGTEDYDIIKDSKILRTGEGWTEGKTKFYDWHDGYGISSYISPDGFLYKDDAFTNPVYITDDITKETRQAMLVKENGRYNIQMQPNGLYFADENGVHFIASVRDGGSFLKAELWEALSWEPGSPVTKLSGVGLTGYISETGVLFRDAKCTQPIYFFDPKSEAATTGNLPGYCPIVLQANADGVYLPHVVGGAYNLEVGLESSAAQALASFEGLNGHSTVVAIGGLTGKDLKLDPDAINSYDSSGTAEKIDKFTQLAEKLIEQWQNLNSGDDTIDGGKGIDILFGDRLVDASEDAPKENIKFLIEKLGLTENDNAAAFLAALAANADDVAKWLDGDDFSNGGNDTLIGGKGNDILFGMGGNDTLIGDSNGSNDSGAATTADRLSEIIGDGSDLYSQDGLPNIAKLAQIAEKLNELDMELKNDGDGNDRLYGGNGEDTLYGGGGDDYLDGGSGNDILIGGDGNDTLIGGDGNDILIGGAGDDTLIGGDGNDILIGGDGDDTLIGGAGDDLIIFDESDYLIDGGSGLDIILAGDTEMTLDEMIQNYANRGTDNFDKNTPMVNDVEVMIKGLNLEDIKSYSDLSQFGIQINNNQLSLDRSQGWDKGEGNTFANGNGITIETSNLTDISSETDNIEMITLQMTVQTNSGSTC